MKVQCESCGTTYNLPDEKVSEKGTPVKCKMCGHVFVVHRQGAPRPFPVVPPPSTEAPRPSPTTPPAAPAEDTRPARPPVPPRSAAEEELEALTKRRLLPSENWIKFALAFVLSVGVIALGFYFYTFTRDALEVWEKVDQQIAASAELEADKTAWEQVYSGQALLLREATGEACTRARRLFGEAARSKPDLAAAHAGLAEAIVCAVEGTDDPAALAEAETAARRALELDPKAGYPHRAAAAVALARGDLARAQEEAVRALALDEGDGATHLLQARIHLRRNEPNEAAESLKTAIANNPLLLDGHFLLAQLHANRRDWSQAVGEAKLAAGINPNHPEVTQYLAIYQEQLARSTTPGASPEQVEREGVLGPDLPPPPNPIDQKESYTSLMQSGNNFRKRGALWEAVGAYQKAADLEPRRCEPHAGLGFVYYDLNQTQAAKDAFRRALGVGPGCNQAYLGLATIYQDEGDRAKAIENYETFLRVSPTGPDAAEVRTILENLRKGH